MRVAVRFPKCHTVGGQVPPAPKKRVAGGTWVALQNSPSATQLNRTTKPFTPLLVALGHFVLILTHIEQPKNVSYPQALRSKCIYTELTQNQVPPATHPQKFGQVPHA